MTALIVIKCGVFMVAVMVTMIDASMLRYFNSMRNYNTTKPTDWSSVLRKVPKQCSLKHVHHIGRHGTRAPSLGQMSGTLSAVAKIRQNLSSKLATADRQRLERASKWQVPDAMLKGEYLLLDRGADELMFISSNYYRLLQMNNLTGPLLFYSTTAVRAMQSSEAFRTRWIQTINGTLATKNNGTAAANLIVLPNFINDRLSFYRSCQRYSDEVRNNVTALKELHDIEKSPLAIELVQRFNRRFFNNVTVLKYEELYNMYQLAGYESAINGSDGSSVLTDLFTDDDLEFFDYATDMEDWWQSAAYSYPMNSDASCGLTKFIFGMAPPPRVKAGFPGIFEFAHSETIIPLITAFGFYKDEQPLKANVTREFIRKRNYQNSKFMPFAANMAFLFYDCLTSSSSVEQRVVLIHNDNVEHFTNACPMEDACPLNLIRAKYANRVTNCSMDAICAPRIQPTFLVNGIPMPIRSSANGNHQQTSAIILLLSLFLTTFLNDAEV